MSSNIKTQSINVDIFDNNCDLSVRQLDDSDILFLLPPNEVRESANVHLAKIKVLEPHSQKLEPTSVVKEYVPNKISHKSWLVVLALLFTIMMVCLAAALWYSLE